MIKKKSGKKDKNNAESSYTESESGLSASQSETDELSTDVRNNELIQRRSSACTQVLSGSAKTESPVHHSYEAHNTKLNT